jgi:hypothetical protein
VNQALRAPATPLPPPPASAAEPSADPFAVRGALREEALAGPARLDRLGAFPAAPKSLPAPSAACDAFVKRAPSGAPVCKGLDAALASLDAALSATDAASRDAQLVDLEACPALPVGAVRALRAELAPIACADALVAPALASPPRTLETRVEHAMLGLAVAGRLSRTVASVPQLDPPFDKERVLKFIQKNVAPWLNDELSSIDDLRQQGGKLQGYGRAVAALEAGLAMLRMVDAVRKIPVAEHIASDVELKAVYEAALEQKLDPLKDRGRDLTLIGLGELAALGVLHDERVARARILLSQMYAGRRIDALDGIALPDLPAANPTTPRERLASRLPTFYAGLVLEPENALSPSFFRALMDRGIPIEHRAALRGKKLDPAVRTLYARARIVAGQTYWRAVDFDEAVALAREGGDERAPEATFYLALALALRNGPEDAAQMMRRPPPDGLWREGGDTTALDAVAKKGGALASTAAFDAAWVRFIGAPKSPDPPRWKDIASRFRAAAAATPDPALRDRALERARVADDIASTR